jgi:hypothetical protein
MGKETAVPAIVEDGPGEEDDGAPALDATPSAHCDPRHRDAPAGLQRSPYASDGGHLIGRDPRDLTVEEWREIHPSRLVGLKAIRAKCLDCAYTPGEVRRCVVVDCPLWPLRMGSIPPGFRASAQ